MAKRNQSDTKLKAAMADALASVERIEGESRKASEQASGADDAPEIEVDVGTEAPGVMVEGADGPREITDPDEQKNQLLRLGADFENFRKRAAKELSDARKYGTERVLAELLGVLDNLQRALAHAEGDDTPVVTGVRMVAKQFQDVLAMFGVRGFDSVGETFDPQLHEAMGQIESEEHEPGTICQQMLGGYFIHDRLLRPAQVIVAAEKPGQGEPDSSQD